MITGIIHNLVDIIVSRVNNEPRPPLTRWYFIGPRTGQYNYIWLDWNAITARARVIISLWIIHTTAGRAAEPADMHPTRPTVARYRVPSIVTGINLRPDIVPVISRRVIPCYYRVDARRVVPRNETSMHPENVHFYPRGIGGYSLKIFREYYNIRLWCTIYTIYRLETVDAN